MVWIESLLPLLLPVWQVSNRAPHTFRGWYPASGNDNPFLLLILSVTLTLTVEAPPVGCLLTLMEM